MINIFFQEWAPLFPILHRPTFLDIYEKYVADPESITNRHAIAQLNLIFGISALSAEVCSPAAIFITIIKARCSGTNKMQRYLRLQWRDALEIVKEDNSLQTLQCLILAQLYTIIKADYKKLQLYRGMALPLSQRLGLHQSQKRFSLGALTCETRKKIFWTLYTLDWYDISR